MKLVLFENPDAPERLNHLGVEVFEAEDVSDAASRLEQAGIMDRVQINETCCHATQDKVWAKEPQGLSWEWYRITDDEPDAGRETLGTTCCTDTDGVETAGAR